MKFLPLCCVFLFLDRANSARILAVLPIAAKSHHAFFQPILKTLARSGHDVTVYSPFPQKEPIPNYTDVFVKTPLTDEKKWDSIFWDFVHTSQFAMDKAIWDTGNQACEEVFSKDPYVDLMSSNDSYDLVITQALVGQESMLVFGHKFQAPTIALHTKSSSTVDNRVSGNSLALSFIPDIGLPYSNSMSILERVFNAYSKLSVLYHHYFDQIPRQEALLKQVFRDPTLPPLWDMVYNISLIFTLGHATAMYSQPSTPNIVPLGGIHIDAERKPLPQDIQIWMDEAEHGVVYFSLGTYVPDHLMEHDYFLKYINAFKKIPQRVLWKTRATNISGLPNNVMIGKWMPQQDILAHPKCVLFITHGGLLSQHEAIHFGVPVIGVPYISDQPMNVKFYEEYGLGVKLDFRKLTEEAIYNAVTTVLGNPMFKENAQRISRLYRDRPMTPEESVVYWTEYVLRHGGAPHLKPSSAQLDLFQLALLDVIAIILLVLLSVIYVLILVMKYVYKYVFQKRNKKMKKH